MNEGRNAIYRDSTLLGSGLAVKLLLVHSRDDLRKSNFVVAAHKGVGQAAVESASAAVWADFLFGPQFIFMSVQHAALSVYLPAAFDQFLINSVPKFHLDCSSSAHSNGLETVATSRKLLFGILDHPFAFRRHPHNRPSVILCTRSICHPVQRTTETPFMRWLQLRFDCDSTAVRLPFDCWSCHVTHQWGG